MSRIWVFLGLGVMTPVLLSSSVGIVSLALGDSSSRLVVAVLCLCFAAAALGGTVTVGVLLGNRARRARLREDLTASVSHELRTPLSSIRMYAQTLLAGTLDQDPEGRRQSLETIVRETQWLESMVDRILAWRARKSGRVLEQMEVQPLGPILLEASERFSLMVPPEGTRFTHDIRTHTKARCEPMALGTAVLNLLVNAYKHSPAPRHIHMAAWDTTSGVAIRVRDNGPGVPVGERKKVFAAFYQVKQPGGGAGGGLGLGLSVVEHIVRSHSGTVSVQSAEGGGALFQLCLPGAVAKDVSS